MAFNRKPVATTEEPQVTAVAPPPAAMPAAPAAPAVVAKPALTDAQRRIARERYVGRIKVMLTQAVSLPGGKRLFATAAKPVEIGALTFTEPIPLATAEGLLHHLILRLMPGE